MLTASALIEDGITESLVQATEHAMGTADAKQRGRSERGLYRFENEVQHRHELPIVQARAEARRGRADGQGERVMESAYVRTVLERAGAYLALLKAHAAVEDAERALARAAQSDL